MERRQFLTRVLATGVGAIGVATLGGVPALGAAQGSTKVSAAEQWLLTTGRRALS